MKIRLHTKEGLAGFLESLVHGLINTYSGANSSAQFAQAVHPITFLYLKEKATLVFLRPRVSRPGIRRPERLLGYA